MPIKNISVDIEIYKNFELVTMNPSVTNFKWRRRFSNVGEFQLETFFTTDKFINIFEEGNIIYKRDVDEAAIIENKKVIQTINNELLLIVSGRTIESILDRRKITLAGDYSINNFFRTVMNNNFLNPLNVNRKMQQLRLLDYNLPQIDLNVDFKGTNVLDEIVKILELNNLGFKIFYNLKENTYDLMFYNAINTDTIFSREFANIIEQDYMDSSEKYKNVIYVGEDFIYGDANYKDMERREIFVEVPSEGSKYLQQTALNALNDNKRTKTLSNVINAYGKQFEYLKDWTIGSIVLVKNEDLDYLENEIISEVTEFYDATGKNLEVNLGDYIQRGAIKLSN